MKTNLTILTLFLALFSVKMLSAKANKEPDFSWDKIPVCIHLASNKTDFSEEQLKFMAKFPIICLEKTQGVGVYGNMEKGTQVAAQGIKKYNTNSKVLFYWNSRIDYGDVYSFGSILEKKPEWIMKDAKGEAITVHAKKRLTYNPMIKEFRDWWVSVPTEQLNKDKNLDGVFVDAVLQYLASPAAKIKAEGKEKYDKTLEGVYSMLTEMRKNIGDDKLIVANSLRGLEKTFPNMGLDFYDYIDAGMMEHFCALSAEDKDVIVKDIALIQEAAKRGKAVIVKGWPTFNFANMGELKHSSQKSLEQQAMRDITFPLACFLVAAGEKSYFCYSWGYNENQGGLIDYPEYNRALGKPKADAKKDGYVYTREFEHCSVWVDIASREAMINWKN